MLFGILGLGSIGDRHARNLMDLGHQVIFYDPNKLGSLPRDQVLKQADAVLICTPSKNHAFDLVCALNEGKHVFVEKPICYDAPSYVSGLIVGSRGRFPNQIVATGYMCRFHPEVQAAKQDVQDGLFGKITDAEFHVLQKNTKPDYLRDGVIRNWLSHEFDLARYLLGNLHVDSANCLYDNENEEMAAVVYTAAIDHDEATVVFAADYVRYPPVRRFTIRGSKWAHTYDLEQGQDIWDQTYIDEMKAFINQIEGKPFGQLADGADGVAAMEMVMVAREKAGIK